MKKTYTPQQCLDDIYKLVPEFSMDNFQPLVSHILMYIEEAFQEHRLDDIDYLLEHIDFDRINKQVMVSLSRGSFRGRTYTPHWRSHVDKTYLWLKDNNEDADQIMRGLMKGSKVIDPRYIYKSYLKDYISMVDFFSPPNAIDVWMVIDDMKQKDSLVEWFKDDS